ncbi:molybdate transport system ATP-binding protein [Bacillus fengqiuensis]|nr:molybdate transport system ATP-binding protein [Bacillus fengqiuensis]
MLKVAMTKTINHFRLKVEFEAGSGITGIIGPSGCGKSMTLQCIAGLQTPDHGEIIVNNRPLYQTNNRINIKSKDRNIGYVFQNYALFPHLTVEKNIEYGLKGLTKRERKEKVTNMIQKVRLAGYEHHYPSQLSGGQQQRAALARTLVTEPSLLLLDEPFSALDHHVKHILEQELLRIIKENYSGIVLLVTHNMEEAYRLCDSLILYNDGHIIQSGTKEAVFKKPMNVSAAKVIGCQNILPVDSLVERKDHLECTVEGVALRIPKQPITENTKHIGIYGENVRFIEAHGPSHNAYHCHILDVVKGIHQTSVRLKVENSFVLHASIPNHQLPSLLHGEFKVELAPNELLLLDE